MKTESIRELSLRLLDEELAARRVASTSRRIMRDAAVTFLRWSSQRATPDIRTLGKKDLAAYHAWLCRQASKRSGETLAASTINTRFHVVLTLFSCLYRAGLIAENPGHNMSLKVPEPAGWKRRPLSRDEITRFLEAIDTSQTLGLRDRTLYELIYSSGLRVSEAAAIKVADIDFDRRLMVVRGKFDRDRLVPISGVAHEFLLHFLGERIDHPGTWVFPGYHGHLSGGVISLRFRRLLKQFGMDKPEISTHSIRHSTATHLLENGASVRHVQELLGHSCIESTVRYTHVMTDNLAKVYRKHHPREHELYEEVDVAYDRRLARLANPG